MNSFTSRVSASWPAVVLATGLSRVGLGTICVGAGLIGVWNVFHYPPIHGYDAAEHMAYADGLIPGGRFPQGVGEYYTPPGYYAVAGTLDWLARGLGLGEPHRAGMAVNVLFLLGTVVLVWRIARELFPAQERLALAAGAFTVLLPVTVRMEAMFHPEMMSLCLTTLALWLCVRTFADRRYAAGLGVVLGLDQLVRASALTVVLAVVVALVGGRRWRQLAIVATLAALVPAPWYIHQGLTYGGNPAFPRPIPPRLFASNPPGTAARSRGPLPIWERRPARFYIDPGVPNIVLAPYTPHLNNLLIPTTYNEIWGDYVGVWAWVARSSASAPSPTARHRLQIQSLVGFLPTLLAVVGWVMLLFASRRRPPLLAVALLPLIGVAAYLFFTVNWALGNGTMLKASYMLPSTAGWALGFGYALSRLRGRAWQVAAAVLALCALTELPFLIYG